MTPATLFRLPVAAILGATLLGGCSFGHTTGLAPVDTLPAAVVPELAGYQVVDQPKLAAELGKTGSSSLVDKGDVYVIRQGATVEGSLQVSLFTPKVNSQDETIQSGIENSLDSAGRGFQIEHFGFVRLLAASVGLEQLYLWFPPEHNVMELFVMRNGFADASGLVRTIVSYQLGLDPRLQPLPTSSPVTTAKAAS